MRKGKDPDPDILLAFDDTKNPDLDKELYERSVSYLEYNISYPKRRICRQTSNMIDERQNLENKLGGEVHITTWTNSKTILFF